MTPLYTMWNKTGGLANIIGQYGLGHCEVQITKILVTKDDDTESDQSPYEFVFVNRRGEEKKDKWLIRVNEGWVCSSAGEVLDLCI